MEKIYALKDPITLEIKYIGQTTLNLYRRLTRHVSEALTRKEETPKRKWIKDLIKQELCPIISLIEFTDNSNEREQYWISKYKDTIFNKDSFIKYSKGNSKKVYGMCLPSGNIIEFMNAKEAAEKTQTSQSNIIKAIHSKTKANNFLWSYNKKFKVKKTNVPTLIILTDIENNTKYIFRSITDAINFIGGTYISLKNGALYALKHKDKEYKGYFWDYAKEHVKLGEFKETPKMDNLEPSQDLKGLERCND